MLPTASNEQIQSPFITGTSHFPLLSFTTPAEKRLHKIAHLQHTQTHLVLPQQGDIDSLLGEHESSLGRVEILPGRVEILPVDSGGLHCLALLFEFELRESHPLKHF